MCQKLKYTLQRTKAFKDVFKLLKFKTLDSKNVLLASGLSRNFTRSVRHFVSFAILRSNSGKISFHIF